MTFDPHRHTISQLDPLQIPIEMQIRHHILFKFLLKRKRALKVIFLIPIETQIRNQILLKFILTREVAIKFSLKTYGNAN